MKERKAGYGRRRAICKFLKVRKRSLRRREAVPGVDDSKEALPRISCDGVPPWWTSEANGNRWAASQRRMDEWIGRGGFRLQCERVTGEPRPRRR